MTDERMARDSAARDEATDHVIREMTHVRMSDDAVGRVMARVRAASDATGHAAIDGSSAAQQSTRGWFGALREPRISWGAAMTAVALAAIVAAGATLSLVRNGGRAGDRPRSASIASAASTATPVAATAAASTTAPPTTSPTAMAATNGTARVRRTGAATPIVTPVKRGHGLNATRDAGGANQTVSQTVAATMVATPDEEPSPAQQASATRSAASAAGAAGAVQQDVRLDVTITDQSGSSKPIAKTVSMIVADREQGSVQSETRVPFQQEPVRSAGGNTTSERWEMENLPLNVTMLPTILSDGHVRVKLVLSYRTASQAKALSNQPVAMSSMTKNLSAVLVDGKPMIVSESADAATDRKVTVELKATIQK